MVEVLQFIFGGTVLWGVPRFIGICILLSLFVALFDRFKPLSK